uniref:Uncharacterized protein n=1 Tax=Anguilla anguilla TaxID=7936 RepID=A0A0E9R2B3_ANGAN
MLSSLYRIHLQLLLVLGRTYVQLDSDRVNDLVSEEFPVFGFERLLWLL